MIPTVVVTAQNGLLDGGLRTGPPVVTGQGKCPACSGLVRVTLRRIPNLSSQVAASVVVVAEDRPVRFVGAPALDAEHVATVR